ncbi:Heparan-alpha-glucosaminide N-acetyltransferase-like protein [Drosera capensis]
MSGGLCLILQLMILVDDAGGEWPMITHAPWDGCNLADFVMPFFLFIVGMANPLALMRIALAYLVVALLEIATKSTQTEEQPMRGCSIFRVYCWQWLAGACIRIIYFSVFHLLLCALWNVCSKLGVHCPESRLSRLWRAFNLVQACTANSPYEGPLRPDAPSWCHAPFEPEGILSSISAILSTIIGVHYGHGLVHMKTRADRLKHWILMGLAFLVIGIILHLTHALPLNKQLYTFSYVRVTSGAAALVFSFSYVMLMSLWCIARLTVIDFKCLLLPLKWIGMNAMLVYVMAAEGIFAAFINGWYYGDPRNTLQAEHRNVNDANGAQLSDQAKVGLTNP